MMEMIRNGLIFDMMTWIPARRGDPTLMTETIGDEIFDTHLSIVNQGCCNSKKRFAKDTINRRKNLDSEMISLG